MIDLTKYSSLERVTDEEQIASALTHSHEKWIERHPLAAKNDWAHTEVRVLPSGQSYVTKRTPIGKLTDAVDKTREQHYADLAKKRGFEWAPGSLDRVVRYWASDERQDRHGDRVEQSWDMDEYELNPIMLFGHQWHQPSIGGILDWIVEPREDRGYKGDALRLDALFAREQTSKTADGIYRLVNAGFLPSGSVGFFPTEVIRPKDAKERLDLGLGEDGYIFRENKLIEWSPCSVPANPGAHQVLNSARQKSLILPTDAALVREMVRVGFESKLASSGDADREWGREDARVVTMWKLVFGVSLPEHKDISQPFDPEETVGKAGAQVQGATLDTIAEQLKDMSSRLVTVEETTGEIRESLEALQVERSTEQHVTDDAAPSASSVIAAVAAKMAAAKVN